MSNRDLQLKINEAVTNPHSGFVKHYTRAVYGPYEKVPGLEGSRLALDPEIIKAAHEAYKQLPHNDHMVRSFLLAAKSLESTPGAVEVLTSESAVALIKNRYLTFADGTESNGEELTAAYVGYMVGIVKGISIRAAQTDTRSLIRKESN